ncbi:MAG: 4-hydroxy-tetrahydrodipicolinate synthase [Myxococcales bacterium]|nr:4-hydroxy-tetrahydrodipicolinate synthase [Myxococcales bacterium]
MFVGVYTALITPFRDGAVDHKALARLVEQQLAAGIDGLVPCGTTGEGTTLTDAERLAVIGTTIDVAAGRCQVIAGVGTNDTAQTVRLAQAARGLGADGALVITPYYNKPSQEGLFHHSRVVAEQGGLPVMLYNVPSRTSVSFTPETIERLASVPGVVSVKEATADMVFDADLLARVAGRLTVLSGDDATAFPLWALGGQGVVSVTSNLMPDRMVGLWRAFQTGDLAAARAAHYALLPAFRGLFWETNPTPLKRMMAWADPELSAELRLPLVPPTVETEARLRDLARSLGLPAGK